MSDHARETEHVPPSAAPGARASGPRETLRGIEAFIDEFSELGPSPLTPHGRDCVRAILLAFAAHVRRQAASASSGEAGPPAQEDLHQQIINLPCVVPFGVLEAAYRLGHRDARHAAAELVAASRGTAPAVPEDWWSGRRLVADAEVYLLSADDRRTLEARASGGDAPQCPHGEPLRESNFTTACPCSISTRHEWFEAFCAERVRASGGAAAALRDHWQPIETAPKGEAVVLCAANHSFIVFGDWDDYDQVNAPQFTHWMPLPAAPVRAAAPAPRPAPKEP